MSCPEYFADGEVNKLTCAVNMTSISNAQCLVPPTSIDFKFISVFGILTTVCSFDYPSSNCVPQGTSGTCFCANQTDDMLTYQFNLVANKYYEGGNFTCDICRLPFIPLVQESSPHCSRIKLGMYSLTMFRFKN